MEIKSLSVDPVGQAMDLQVIKDYITGIVASWKNTIATQPWWKFWAGLDLKTATGFFIVSVDNLIAIVEKQLELGSDKKATVLAALDQLYGTMVLGSAPVFLKPVLMILRNYIIYTLCSMLIDWTVSKYNDGAWRQNAS
jgi:hypothetical protein